MAEYDAIAEDYKDSKELPFRIYAEAYTLFEIAGNIEGKRVLDLACGEGFYTRKLKKAGASNVLGVDLSSEMIKLAKVAENLEPLGCQYQVGDASVKKKLGDFDLVVGMYLLNYASTAEEVLAFCRSAYMQLERGGSFIGFNDNVLEDQAYYESYEKYGFIKKTTKKRKDGDPITYVFKKDDGSTFEFNNFYLNPDIYSWAFKEAGFKDFNWITPMLHASQSSNEFWKEFIDHPPIIAFSASK